jgi:hypothetical protein
LGWRVKADYGMEYSRRGGNERIVKVESTE